MFTIILILSTFLIKNVMCYSLNNNYPTYSNPYSSNLYYNIFNTTTIDENSKYINFDNSTIYVKIHLSIQLENQQQYVNNINNIKNCPPTRKR